MLWLHQAPHIMVTILYPMSLSMWVTSMVRINTHNVPIIVYLIAIAYSPQHVDCLRPLLTNHGAYQLRD